MAKNNQKKEKALRNLENARKYRKKNSDKRRRGFGPRPSAGPSAAGPSVGGPSTGPSVGGPSSSAPASGPSA